ncbi:MAG: N-methyl-L-tryptophan oxidase [Hyphomicrobiales bacterium]|nr:N-methyl-L-tryptophan oxidase [Hyphomicrobiales bacterium]
MAYDVIVIGLGVMGSAALHALAQRGKRVLGLERHTLGHDLGSSHGHTRLIRLGYFEHPSYVPLLRRAYALWRELERAADRSLLHSTGIAEIGAPEGRLVRGTLAASRLHGLAHEVLTARELTQRHPAFRLPSEYVAVVQPDGGYLEVEPALAALASLAQHAGADIRCGATVEAIAPRLGGVEVITDHGRFESGAAVITVGAWTSSLVPITSRVLRATRQVMAWFDPIDAAAFASCPVFILESRHGMHYGVPPCDGAGVKVAKHHHRDQTVDPQAYDHAVGTADEALVRAAVAEHIPAANGRLLSAKTCLYTVTPDHDFLIDRLPGAQHVVLASPCSGHGFKFAPVVGEILADLATDGATTHDISRFSLGRFG